MSHRFDTVSRREFLAAGAGLVVAPSVLLDHSRAAGHEQNSAPGNRQLTGVKALVFDVFGTVVDWRTSITREVAELAKRKSVKVDAAKFADAWRAGYAPSMNRVRTGELPWTKLDNLHRMVLDKLLVEFGITGLTEAETAELNRAWHRLQPWPDAVGGLTRLKKAFLIAPLSNGNVALLTNMAKHAGLPWDCILGAELVRHYKPDREVYQSAADFLDLQPGEVMMVAAHLNDLRAAKGVGLKTALVLRPLEYGPSRKPELTADGSVDVTAKDFQDLASKLGA